MVIALAAFSASALWGLVFSVKARRGENIFGEIGRASAPLFYGTFLVFAVSWLLGDLVFFVVKAVAHEGIKIVPLAEFVRNGFTIGRPLVVILAGIMLLHGFFFLRKEALFLKYGLFLYFAALMAGVSLLAFTVFTGSLGGQQLFFVLHNLHPILTLGTVISIDFLYLQSLRRRELARAIYGFFPNMSACIWIGLAVDFFTSLLFFGEAFRISGQFLFVQTAIAVIVLNGALLSGKVNAGLIASADSGSEKEMGSRFKIIVGLSGSVSAVSWLSIYSLDFLELPFGYPTLFAWYIMVIAAVFIGHHVMDKNLPWRSAAEPRGGV